MTVLKDAMLKVGFALQHSTRLGIVAFYHFAPQITHIK